MFRNLSAEHRLVLGHNFFDDSQLEIAFFFEELAKFMMVTLKC